jgi:hypothetical protein
MLLVAAVSVVWGGALAVERYLDYQADAIFRGLSMADWQPPSAGNETPQEIRPAWPVLQSEGRDTLGLATRALRVRHRSDATREFWLIEVESSGLEQPFTATPTSGRLSIDGEQPVVALVNVAADSVEVNSYLVLNGELLPIALDGPVDSVLVPTTPVSSDRVRND